MFNCFAHYQNVLMNVPPTTCTSGKDGPSTWLTCFLACTYADGGGVCVVRCGAFVCAFVVVKNPFLPPECVQFASVCSVCPALFTLLQPHPVSHMATTHDYDYRVKRIRFGGREDVPIFAQNLNGPCPLLAISNVLSLRNQLQMPGTSTSTSTSRLITMVADRLLTTNTAAHPEEEPNLNQHIADCLGAGFMGGCRQGADGRWVEASGYMG